ncbi:MAG: potassium-transporting ATPase subunit KdpC [Bacteroidota bacterium]
MKTLIISLKIFLFFTILTGIVYPLLVTGITQVLFPSGSNGGILYRDAKPLGSELIGQAFDSSVYFSSRPSAIAYNPLPSGGTNFGLTNVRLKRAVDSCKLHFIAFNQLKNDAVIPSEMLFSSASGLDPHISPEAALLQVARIAAVRNFNPLQKQKLYRCIKELTEPPQLLCLGENRINVLLLNLATDKIQ